MHYAGFCDVLQLKMHLKPQMPATEGERQIWWKMMGRDPLRRMVSEGAMALLLWNLNLTEAWKDNLIL